jgi:hypothetical protein
MEYTTEIPGLPGGPLVTTYPIKFRIVPEQQTINRPGIIARLPRRSVQHGNGNPNAIAAADALYLFNGARDGNGIPQQVSYHATSDDTEVWICIPLDEVTWQAADGGGPGNMNGLSLEMSEYAPIWNDAQRSKRCVAIAADFMGRCAARFGIAIPEQHWTFNYALPPNLRHDCPNRLRHATIDGKPAWDIYVAAWNESKQNELQRMLPPKPKPPQYATPELPEWWARALAQRHPSDADVDGVLWRVMRRRFEALRNAQRYSRPDTSSPKAGPKIETRTKIDAERQFTLESINAKGETVRRDWLVEDSGAFLTAAAFDPKVTVKAR